MKPSTFAITLGVAGAALALAAAPARATVTVQQDVLDVCFASGNGDHVIGASDQALLIFEDDGDLAMYATNSAGTALWSSGTAGSDRELCVGADGSLAVNNHTTGAVLWHRDATNATLSIDDCNVIATSKSTGAVTTLVADSCPGQASTTLFDGWCTDATSEVTLVTSDWASLKWLTTGKLAVVGTGARAGETMWTTSTAGAKLCFEDGGRLAIYATTSATTPSWTSNSLGSTADAYVLGLDDCAITIANFQSGAEIYDTGTTCTNWSVTTGRTVTGSTTADTVVLENADAELVVTSAARLVLRRQDGDVIWQTATTSTGTATPGVAFTGGYLAATAGGWPIWYAGSATSGAQTLRLDGCRLEMVDSAGTAIFARGEADCDQTSYSLGSTASTIKVDDSELTLLRGSDSYLVWTSAGNLCLYAASGTQVWCALSSSTASATNYLSLEPSIGRIRIYASTGTFLWGKTGTYAKPTFPITYLYATQLTLGDSCKLSLAGASGSAYNVINAACVVGKYAWEDSRGNDTFGVTMATSMTATAGTSSNTVVTSSNADLDIFGQSKSVWSADYTRTSYSDGSTGGFGAIEVLGEDVGLSFSVSRDFYEKKKTLIAGTVPLVVSAGASGSLGVAFTVTASSSTVSAAPTFGAYASVAVGVGVETDTGGWSAGVKGTLTLVEIALPLSVRVYKDSGTWKFAFAVDLDISTLGGNLALYAEVFLKVGVWKFGVEISKSLIEWTGLYWSKNLVTTQTSF